ncbi:MAG TPA: hypothetical protein PK052_00105 [Anaerohalosphaeraceae bacterium]|nr:hypothetical protein [Anaerohalosphaeraceae bacterium]HOL30356.1 hypothetical protein [Anaerohalosphaeraceae bacterium]HOM76716.1 hypothetical protein [Anaerohalosphaeraceae bacterium]HPC63054.1 hypothetical protein [Anaerohalosphaeraceae bacterium]HPO69253.1 hypothetical protein [Anaerohalosphaeraceae bacterium]
MIEKIYNNQIQNIAKEFCTPSSGDLSIRPNIQADASLQLNCQSLMEQASLKSADADDGAVVERARQLLLSGQLDTPENIRQAAQNILKFGV